MNAICLFSLCTKSLQHQTAFKCICCKNLNTTPMNLLNGKIGGGNNYWKVANILMASSFTFKIFISILRSSSSMAVESVSYITWKRKRTTEPNQMQTCWKCRDFACSHTWAFLVSWLQTSFRLWISTRSCWFSRDTSWILSAFSSRFWCIWLHCLESSSTKTQCKLIWFITARRDEVM